MAEVCEPLCVNQHVLGLEVAVDEALAVHVLDAERDRAQVVPRPRLGQRAPLPLDDVEQVASLGQLEIGGICTCLASNPAGLERCEGPASDYQDPAGLCNGCGERYSNLGEQLETLNGGRPLALGCEVDEGDGPRPAICLDASFSAERLSFSPMNCAGL